MIITDILKLSEIAESMCELIKDTSEMSIVFKVKDQETLNKINEDLYYRNNMAQNGTELVNDPKEVMVNIMGVRFEYVVKDNTETIYN